MKKLFLLAMIGMISLTSCSNSNDEFQRFNEPEKTNLNSKKEDLPKASRLAIISLKNVQLSAASGKPAKPEESVYIACHSDYSASYGHACVYSGGYLFNVTWSNQYNAGGGFVGFYPDGPDYIATQVTSCGC